MAKVTLVSDAVRVLLLITPADIADGVAIVEGSFSLS